MRMTRLTLVAFGLAVFAAPAAGQGSLPGAPAAPPAGEEPKLVFEREVYNYPQGARRDPFRPLTAEDSGPMFGDLTLRMILFSRDNPARSVAVVKDAAGKTHRLRRGESVGSATVVDIGPRRVLFSVEEFGVRRQEVLELKPTNQEGA